MAYVPTGKPRGRPKKDANEIVHLNGEQTNGSLETISATPYVVAVTLEGVSDLLFHRWNCEAVAAKAAARKNSVEKKTDNIESYVYRNDDKELCIPGEYIRQSIIVAAKYKQDPRSPRKSAKDLYNAGVIVLTQLSTLGVEAWDYEDKRRVVIQRNGINRVRPAMRLGWSADFEIMVNSPEYISQQDLNDTLSMAGRMVGIGDFRPAYGRYQITSYKVQKS